MGKIVIYMIAWLLFVPTVSLATSLSMAQFPPNAASPACPPRPPGWTPPWPQRLDCREPVAGTGLGIRIDDELILSGKGTFLVKGPGDVEILATSCIFPDSYKVIVRDDVTSFTLKCGDLAVGKGVKIMLSPVKSVAAGSDAAGNRLVRLYYCSLPPVPSTEPITLPPTPPDAHRATKGTTGVTGFQGQKGENGVTFNLEATKLSALKSLWIDTSGCNGTVGGPGGKGGKGGQAICNCIANDKRGGDGGDGGAGGRGGDGGATSAVNINIKEIAFPIGHVSTSNSCIKHNDIPIVDYGLVSVFGPGGVGAFPSGWPDAQGIFVWGATGKGGDGNVNGPGGAPGGPDVCGFPCVAESEEGGSSGIGNPSVVTYGATGTEGTCTGVKIITP